MLKRTLASTLASASVEQPPSEPPRCIPTSGVIPIPDEQSPPPPPPPPQPPMSYENYWQASQLNSPQIIGMDGVVPPLPPDLGQSGLPTISWLCSCNLCIESVQQFIAALKNSNGVYAACVSSAGPVYNELLSSANIQMQPPPQIYTGLNGNPSGNVENISVASIGIGSEDAGFSVKIESNRDDGDPQEVGDTSKGLNQVLAPGGVVVENGAETIGLKDCEEETSDENLADGGSSAATTASVDDSLDTASTASLFWGNGSSEWISPDSGSGEENNSAMEGRRCHPQNYGSAWESTDNSNHTDGDDEGISPPPQQESIPKSPQEISENSSS